MEFLHLILKKDFGNILVNPTYRELNLYSEGDNRIIIKKLPKRAPVLRESCLLTIPESDQLKKGSKPIVKPTIEKILVDIFINQELFPIYFELENIFKGCLSTYSINFNKLFAYAKYRNYEKRIREYIELELDYDISRGCFR
jgi:hypothetical protein